MRSARPGPRSPPRAQRRQAGQSQLSNAMIPYSMAYTDVYTKHLSELTGGTSAGAARYQQQAIDAANEEFSTSADLRTTIRKCSRRWTLGGGIRTYGRGERIATDQHTVCRRTDQHRLHRRCARRRCGCGPGALRLGRFRHDVDGGEGRAQAAGRRQQAGA